MKTLVEVQQELNTYLAKTSQHVFVKTLNNKKVAFRLFDAKTKDGKTLWLGIMLDEELKLTNIIHQVNIDGWGDPNAKNGLKHRFFLNQEFTSVRLKRKTQHIVDEVREVVATMDAPDVNWRVIEQFKKDIIERVLLAQ